MKAWIWRVKQVWYEVNLMQILSETFMLSVTSSRIKAHNAVHLSFSTTMRLSASLYISCDTVRSDFLSAKARLAQSPALTNTFTKLGFFSHFRHFFPGCIEGLCFVSLLLIYLVNGGLTQTGERSGSIWTRSALHSGSEPATNAMDKKSSAFTIDRILSAEDNRILGSEKPSAPGACEEKPAPESTANRESMDLRSTCCFCSHCGEVLHTAASKSASPHLWETTQKISKITFVLCFQMWFFSVGCSKDNTINIF